MMIPKYNLLPIIENVVITDKYTDNIKILDCITDICDILIKSCNKRLKIWEEL